MRKWPIYIGDRNFEGIVTVNRPVDVSRVRVYGRGLMVGLDRRVFIERDDDTVAISVGKENPQISVVLLSEFGWEGNAEDIGSRTLKVNASGSEWGGWKLKGNVYMRDGSIGGDLEFQLRYYPSIRFSLDLRLTGWTPPRKLIPWKE